MEFYRNRKKSIKLIQIYTAIFFAMVLIFIYSAGFFTTAVIPKGMAFSGIIILLLGIVLVNMLIALRDKSPLIVLSKKGITAKVTAVSKAAGLILWNDIIDVTINKVGGDTLITLVVDKPDRYTPLIRKKLSSIAVDGANDQKGNLLINLTTSALDFEAPELFTTITSYRSACKL